MLNKVFLNKFFKCGISILKNYKLIKMDILICSVVLFGYLVLFFFFMLNRFMVLLCMSGDFGFFLLKLFLKMVLFIGGRYIVCVYGDWMFMFLFSFIRVILWV